MNENYYVDQKKKLMRGFDKTMSWFRPHLGELYGKEFTDQVLQEARIEYKRLIPLIPFIGGSKVHMTEDLMESVRILAYLRVLKANGKTVDECKEIVYRGMETRIAQYPRLVLKLGGIRAFSKPFRRYLQTQAKESQERKYPQGFVFDFVNGNGEEFDWGLNIYECGICKFYQEQDAFEFMKMLCLIDYVLSDKLGYGLYRTETLVEGAEKCNPRMKKGGLTQWR
jgi:hypothetical protein